jgi:hypothetical protein
MKIAILDVDSIAFTIGHGNKILLDTVNDQPIYQRDELGRLIYEPKNIEQLEEACKFVIGDILAKGGFTHYIGYIKGKDTIGKKLSINSNYKQDRKTERPAWWDYVSNYLVTNFNIYLANNYEVDDYVVSHFRQLPNSHIVAIDSDILSVEGTHYNWRKDEWVNSTKDNEIFAFWSQMITGNHNNIKGIPGKGIKYAEKLFEKLNYKTDLEYAELVFSDYLVNFKLEGIEEYYKNYKSIKIFDSVNIDDNSIKEWNLF